jgi:F0F1-type ATP synthase delta subunit
MASRMQVAQYVADELPKDRTKAVQAAAAWLVERGRGRDARYLARDVAAVLAAQGHVLAQVITARPLEAGARQAVEGFIKETTGAKEIELETSVDKTLIGGIKIELPNATMDATVRAKLDKFVEGMKL